VTVVRDAPDLLALYLPPGTPWKEPRRPDGGPARLPVGPWTLADARTYNHVLRFNRPSDAHAVFAFWSEDGRFLQWYINLEDPIRRTPSGFQYMDMVLDIVVAPNLSSWTWKDEDEFREAQERGMVSREAARAIRAEGERALELMQARVPPFDGAWRDWRPDPSWTVPQLPEGWDVV
jgi:hypothetical protein